MKKCLTVLLVIMLSNWILAQENFVQNQVIVKLSDNYISDGSLISTHNNFMNDELNEVLSPFNIQKITAVGNKREMKSFLVQFQSDVDVEAIAAELSMSNFVAYAEPNYFGHGAGEKGESPVAPPPITPNDNYFFRQYGSVNDGSFALSPAVEDADIDLDLAWEIEQGSESIVVAILDSGAKMDHPELTNRLWGNTNETVNANDEDDNGYIDDLQGWDFAFDDNDPTDVQGHGTNVIGIIGADANNNIGYAGVDWNCRLMVCKVLNDNNFGLYTWWADGIYYAVDNGAHVINMSLGGSGSSLLLEEAVEYAYANDVIIVVSMMNENSDVPYYPAAFDQTFAVGATNPNDERANPFFWSPSSGSSFGEHIDFVAPGNYTYGLNQNSNTYFDSYWGGTSQAAPHVSGLCALMLAQDPSQTPDEIRSIIRNTAEDLVGNPFEDVLGFDIYHGYGRVNAHQALLGIATGINELSDEPFFVSPNPTQGVLQISGKHDDLVEVLNMQGKLVLSRKMTSDIQQINLEDITAGMYLVRLHDAKGNLLGTQKIIKQ